MLDYTVEVYRNGQPISPILTDYDESNLISHLTKFGRSVFPYAVINSRQYGGFVDLHGTIIDFTSQYEGNILQSIMRQIDITIKDDSITSEADLQALRGKPITSLEMWILSPNAIDYVTPGVFDCDLLFTIKLPNMWIYNAEWNEAQHNFKLTCYDSMIRRMSFYDKGCFTVGHFISMSNTQKKYTMPVYFGEKALTVKLGGIETTAFSYGNDNSIIFDNAPSAGTDILVQFSALTFREYAIATIGYDIFLIEAVTCNGTDIKFYPETDLTDIQFVVRVGGIETEAFTYGDTDNSITFESAPPAGKFDIDYQHAVINAENNVQGVCDSYYVKSGATQRDVIDDVCELGACNVICGNDKLILKYPTDTGLSITVDDGVSNIKTNGNAPIVNYLVTTEPINNSQAITKASNRETDITLEINDNALFYATDARQARMFNKLRENSNNDYLFGYDLLEVTIPSTCIFEFGDVISVTDLAGNTHKMMITSSYASFSSSMTERLLSTSMFAQSTDGANAVLSAQSSSQESRRLSTIEQRISESEWIDANLTSDFEGYTDDVTVWYKRSGNVVEIQGACKATHDITGSATMFYLPEGFRPSVARQILCAGGGNTEWRCQISDTGAVSFNNYRNGASSITLNEGYWLPIQAVFIAERKENADDTD